MNRSSSSQDQGELNLLLADIQADIPRLARWIPVRQVGADVSVAFGQMLVYDPADGNLRAFLPPASPIDISKSILFVRRSASTANYTIHAYPGDTIEGAETVVIDQAWQVVTVMVAARALWMGY